MPRVRNLPFDTSAWLSSPNVQSMTLEERGAYIQLLCHSWQSSDGGLPDDDATLASLSQMGVAYRSSKVRHMFKSGNNGRVYNTRLKNLFDLKAARKVAVPDTVKTEYAENVLLTPGEYTALVERYGQRKADACVAVLSTYKAYSGRSYKSDYHAILHWVADSEKVAKAIAEQEGVRKKTANGEAVKCRKCGGGLTNMVCPKCLIDYTPRRMSHD